METELSSLDEVTKTKRLKKTLATRKRKAKKPIERDLESIVDALVSDD